VLVYTGLEMSQADRFIVGARCQLHIRYGSPDEAFWRQVSDAIGCGPTLLRGGEPVVDPEGEGFREKKVTVGVARRSLIGVRQDGTVVMAITSASPRQAAEVLRKLGAVDGMCLDGGASSGLWYRGRYQVRPGRDISNAWVVVREERKKPPAEDGSKANGDVTLDS
jgi:exopolysaccharide biosynthesis protein